MEKVLILCIALLPALPGCDSTSVEDDAPTPGVIAFENIEDAWGFGLRAGTMVIREEGAWTALGDSTWNFVDDDGLFAPLPAIDFTRKMVIAVSWGSMGGCPQDVQAIETIVQREGEIVVVVGPLPDLGGCDALFTPVQMVQIDRSDLPVVFEGEVPGSGG